MTDTQKDGQHSPASEQTPQTAIPSDEAWPEPWLRALDDPSLMLASSNTTFQRGVEYATAGVVEITHEEPLPQPALCARVHGSLPYLTKVWIEADAIAGHCSCPHADDGRFCKHQVAVALIWRERLGGQPTQVDEDTHKRLKASAARANTARQKHQALHDFLHAQPARALADKLLELAHRDREVDRELQQWHKLSALAQTPKTLKPLITEILASGRDFIGWNESHLYVRRAEAVLPLLLQARKDAPKEAPSLCLHALRRIWRTLEHADDSSGEIGDLCEAIRQQWLLSLQAAGPQPASFGAKLLQAQLDDPLGNIDASSVKTAIGKSAYESYRRTLAMRWREAKDALRAAKAELPSKGGNGPKTRRRSVFVFSSTPPHIREHEMALDTLERLHLAQLEADGDLDTALALLREDLCDASAYVKAVEFLERHGRLREALVQAEQGLKAFPDDWQLQDHALHGYERDGWTREALTLRRRQFDTRPDVLAYQRVLKAGQEDGQDMAALRQSLHEDLAARETAQAAQLPSGRLSRQGASALAGVRNVSVRADILCHEKRWAEVCAVVQSPAVCQNTVLVKIAERLPSDYDSQALDMLLRIFHSTMPHATSPYREELALVAQISKRMSPAQYAAWLAKLHVDYKAKRNFIRDLPTP